jgi:hypothetical protein
MLLVRYVDSWAEQGANNGFSWGGLETEKIVFSTFMIPTLKVVPGEMALAWKEMKNEYRILVANGYGGRFSCR